MELSVVGSLIGLLVLGSLGFTGWKVWQSTIGKTRRRGFIARYRFSESLRAKVATDLPGNSSSDIDLVLEGLRQFFTIAHLAGRARIGMPSKVVDIAWHHFILHTIDYQAFCKGAFGRFYNHMPSSPVEQAEDLQMELRRTWSIACRLENVDPGHPTRIPLLYRLDAMLKIEDGHYYELVEGRVRYGKVREEDREEKGSLATPVVLCGGALVGCGGGSSGGGWSWGDGGGGDGGGGCSGGCGGGGCGGGGCGGA